MLRKKNKTIKQIKQEQKAFQDILRSCPQNAIAQRGSGKEERQSRGNCATRMLGRHKLNAHGIGGAKEFQAGKRERSLRVWKMRQ
jgi:cell division septum initiation protein DivIVA